MPIAIGPEPPGDLDARSAAGNCQWYSTELQLTPAFEISNNVRDFVSNRQGANSVTAPAEHNKLSSKIRAKF